MPNDLGRGGKAHNWRVNTRFNVSNNLSLLFLFAETIDNYLKTFQWNAMKYRTDKSLVELAELLNNVRRSAVLLARSPFGLVASRGQL